MTKYNRYTRFRQDTYQLLGNAKDATFDLRNLQENKVPFILLAESSHPMRVIPQGKRILTILDKMNFM